MPIKVKVESEKLVKPRYEEAAGGRREQQVPLSVFDTVTYNTHFSVVYTFAAPTPSNRAIERGLRRVMSEFPEWAGRLAPTPPSDPAILLNDRGARFVEATSDCTLRDAVPTADPNPDLLSLHPAPSDGDGDDRGDPLLHVQLTRFACGGLALGLTASHLVADGCSASLFWVSWGRATRGLPSQPRPVHGRSLFPPRTPPRVEFDHLGAEYNSASTPPLATNSPEVVGDIVVHKARFSPDFLKKLKAAASSGAAAPVARPYTTFESLVAHLWRAVTRARGLPSHVETRMRISVDGRRRLVPRVPDEYFGNLVLWAFPSSTAGELVRRPVSHAARVIREAVAKVDDRYFRSFVDFSEQEKTRVGVVVPTAEMENRVLCPHLEVDSWLRFPFYDVDFGGGPPELFTPTWLPYEGFLVLLASPAGDGSVDVLVPLLRDRMPFFKHICYTL